MHRYHGRNLRRGRYSQTGQIYLVTAVTRGRQAVFSDWRCACACARVLHGMPVHGAVRHLAWVVMPDHVHWLFSLQDSTLAAVMRRFKSCAARAVNTAARRTGALWQNGYHDHAVRQEEDIRALAHYVIANPVRSGLCTRCGDYPYWDAAWL